MTLSELFVKFSAISWGSDPLIKKREPTALCFDSRRLEQGCVFVAIRGTKVDGHDFLETAVSKGAIALVVEEGVTAPPSFGGAVVHVPSGRRALNQLAAVFFSQPSHELFAVGITGTNGKTTVTHMVEAILNFAAKPTGVIGTIDHHLRTASGDHVWKTELTTPDPVEFQGRLRNFIDLGAHAVAMEVSNVGLLQNRVDEVAFDVAVFTNLSRDHLDIHPDMEDYFNAKRRLFIDLLPDSRKSAKLAIINGDDDYGRRLLTDIGSEASEASIKVWSYGAGENHDLRFRVISQGFFGTKFRLATPVGECDFEILMPGLHNVYNAVAAIGAALQAGVSLQTCARALASLTGVKGRLEAVPNKRGVYVFVDYAHTDDAIATVLHYLGKIRQEAELTGKIITVFGCGGDRDKGKRPLMMKAAAAGSDLVVVTSDNPRTENPDAILADILAGANAADIGARVFPVVDRRAGIAKALALASEGDVILIAGKGHEDYQIIGTVKHPFSDTQVVRELLI